MSIPEFYREDDPQPESEVCDHPECIEFRAAATKVDGVLRSMRMDELRMAALTGVSIAIFDAEDEDEDFVHVDGAPRSVRADLGEDEVALIVTTSVSGGRLTKAQARELRDAINLVIDPK